MLLDHLLLADLTGKTSRINGLLQDLQLQLNKFTEKKIIKNEMIIHSRRHLF
jgi:hypothetical protein